MYLPTTEMRCWLGHCRRRLLGWNQISCEQTAFRRRLGGLRGFRGHDLVKKLPVSTSQWILKEPQKHPSQGFFASWPQPAKQASTTLILIRGFCLTSPGLFTSILKKPESPVRGQGKNQHAPTHIRLHSKLPLEVSPSWGKRRCVFEWSSEILLTVA